jgi:hypothetical protein
MILSPKVEVLIKAARSSMHLHPQRLLAPSIRQQIYHALGPKTDSVSNRARGWLAVLSARRVLPIFTQAFPNMPLPQELLDTAAKILHGEVDDGTVTTLLNHGYHAAGNCWGYDEEDMPVSIDLAGSAAYHALKEAHGTEPLTNLHKYLSLGTVTTLQGADSLNSEFKVAINPEPLSGDKWTDERLCHVDAADTAAVAAMAYASQEHGDKYDPQKPEEFWEWWLTEAIPAAWAMAESARDPT